MKYNELQTTSTKNAKRSGRGIAAGRGKTAGRGTKGQNARKSGGVRPGFEGGQNPLMQRLPKLRGFRSIRPKTETVYTSQLKGTVTNASLAEAGVITSPYSKAKVVLNGDVQGKVTVKLQGASASAIKAIEKAGGTFTIAPRPQRAKSTKKTDKTDK